jgi:hypothetical protein
MGRQVDPVQRLISAVIEIQVYGLSLPSAAPVLPAAEFAEGRLAVLMVIVSSSLYRNSPGQDQAGGHIGDQNEEQQDHAGRPRLAVPVLVR